MSGARMGTKTGARQTGNRTGLSSLLVNPARLGPNTAPETNGGQFDNREHNNGVIYSISDQDSDWQGQQRREVGDEWEGGWPSAVGKNGM